MVGAYELPNAVLQLSSNGMGNQVTTYLTMYWAVLMVGAQVMGLVVVIDALVNLNKMYRYNQPAYGQYKIPMIVVGVLLFNLNKFIDIIANTLGIGQNGGLF